ncbi:hypothetical protein G6F40_016648 [Rhizopus arrhizus]|nr:hypothetical protein G6F40_016648 [Rhizopus arrhizus]
MTAASSSTSASSRPPLCMGIPGHRGNRPRVRSEEERHGERHRDIMRAGTCTHEDTRAGNAAGWPWVDLHARQVQTPRRWRRVRRHTHPGVPNPCPAPVEVDLVRRQRWPPPDIGTVCLRWRCARSHPTRQNR